MNRYFGYCRISTPKQSLDRQVRNILAAYPQAEIIKEVYTGRKFQGRKEFDRLMRKITPGDTIIFDSVSRMSRNAEEGFIMYEELYHKEINLIFLKEPHISTETYKKALQGGIPTTGTDIDCILEGINKYLLLLAKEQIRLAFEQSEKEVKEHAKDFKLPNLQVNRSDRFRDRNLSPRNQLQQRRLSRNITKLSVVL